MRAALLGVALAGCGFSTTPATVDGAPDDGTGSEAPPGDTTCASYASLVDTCADTPAGTTALILPAGMHTYSTSNGELTIGGVTSTPPHLVIAGAAGPIDVLFVSSIELAAGAQLRVFGSRALLIAASGTVQIDGGIDSIGPGAGSRADATCGGSVGSPGTDSNDGGGGGGGGAFQGGGGGGSEGNLDGPARAGGPGGVAIARPTGPTGGCDGGRGGRAMSTSGEGGDGGGAIVIASGASITVGVTGVINVGGSGGRGGGVNGGGGGGGGSGGMILVEAPLVSIGGVLAANGGGGGEGNFGMAGQAGLAAAIAARGGAAQDSGGGDGAAGGAGATLGGVTATERRNGGGGGGGGGVGYIGIRSASATTTGTISPAFAPWP